MNLIKQAFTTISISPILLKPYSTEYETNNNVTSLAYLHSKCFYTTYLLFSHISCNKNDIKNERNLSHDKFLPHTY